jgi:hypothetical protein
MPRCKHCKETFEPLRFNQKFCLKSECIAKGYDEHWKKVRKPKMKQEDKENDVKYWAKEAKTICHFYIRQRDKDKGCISCGKKLEKGNIDAGHLWSSHYHSYLRYDEFNINAQCSRPCNKDLSGDVNNYRINFVKRYGIDKLNYLDSMAHKTKRWTIDELKQIIETYKQKLK